MGRSTSGASTTDGRCMCVCVRARTADTATWKFAGLWQEFVVLEWMYLIACERARTRISKIAHPLQSGVAVGTAGTAGTATAGVATNG